MYTNKQIWSVSYPILLSLLAQNVINVTDTAFLGHVSEVALGASAMGGLFYICIFTIAFGFSTGSQIVIARRNGEGRYSDVGPVMIQGVMFLLLIAILMFGFTKAFGGNIMRLLVSSESIYEGTMEFLDWRIYGFFFSFINVMFRALYIGITRTKVLTINAVVMALTNVILDYALIFGKFGLPEMGIKGAAIASVLAEASSILFFLIYTYISVDLKKYGLNRLRSFDPALLMRILSISCFTMLQYFLSMATWFVFFVAVERLGQRELAIANIVRSIYVVLLIPVNALATTTNSLVSNAIGAGGIQYVMPLINKIARFSFFIMLGLVGLSVLFPQFLLSVYTSEAALITESVPSVYVICCAMLIASVANVVFNGISGTGNTQAALLLETITIAIYGSYIVFVGMWLKAPIEICFTIEILYYTLLLLTSYIYLKKAKWHNLSERLERSFKILKGEGKITEINVAETLKDVRKALLDADVNYKVAKTFTDTVKEKAIGQNVLTAVKPSQLMVKIVHDELTQLMGGETVEINLESRPAVILMSGLQGSGKTTFSGKLARMLKTKKNRKPLLVACDVYRPAAIEQLRVLAEQIEVPMYSELDSKNPVEIAQHAIQEAKAKGYDLVIVDTAGRLAVDEQMMNEITAIKEAINPDEILFVVDSMTGQDAVNTAKEFNERLDFNGVVLTKLDGDTRGGAALSIRSVVNKPIKFVGTGEKLDAIDQFHPARMADRILGMGDIVSLVERAQEQYDEEEAKRLQKKIAKNQFDFNDFLSQIAQIKKMGNLKELASMIPGVGKAIKDIDIDDNAFKSIEAIIYSMTPAERSNPELLNGSRRTRIAKGSGTTIQEVNRLLKQFDQTRKMMKMVTSSKMGKMMPKMKK